MPFSFFIFTFFSVIADPYNFIAYINFPIAIAFGVYSFRKRKEITLTKTLTNKLVSNIVITLIITVIIIAIGAFIKKFKGGSNLDPLNLEWIIHHFYFSYPLQQLWKNHFSGVFSGDI